MEARRITAADAALLLLAGMLAAFIGLGVVFGVQSRWEADAAGMRTFVRDAGLTDPALFTEARYTRHLSQADLHSAFQDGPGSLEHFPSGSVVSPPARLRSLNEPDLQ